MKNKNIFTFIIILSLVSVLQACSNTQILDYISSNNYGQIYLYGEQHGVDKILDKEFELWHQYYYNEGMRHLFIEYPYYTAEYLNLWLKSDSDDIIDELYEDWFNTAAYTLSIKEFYKKIKSECPETIFHGTDVGHQYSTTGMRFLEYLESINLKDSEQYLLTQQAIEQGKYYYEHSNYAYRENMMVENFIREFNKLDNENIMGIYGSAHIGLNTMDPTNSIPSMANQLKKFYKDINSNDLSFLAKDIKPDRVNIINVNGKDYEALYFGKQDLTSFTNDYTYREFWRLENAYDDFKDKAKTGNVLPYDNYPMQIETEQIFIIDNIRLDGSVMRMYFYSKGNTWNNRLTTEEFIIE